MVISMIECWDSVEQIVRAYQQGALEPWTELKLWLFAALLLAWGICAVCGAAMAARAICRGLATPRRRIGRAECRSEKIFVAG